MRFEMRTRFTEHMKQVLPLRRCGTALDMAEAIAFLARDQASFITGTLLTVDGGYHAASPL